MQSRSLVIERTYQASIKKVWKALTDKDQMKEWYFEVSDFKPEVGFQFQFYGENANGKKMLHLCVVTEVEAPRKLSYTWGYRDYSGQSLLTFELFEEAKTTTRLKLTHSGTDTFPYDNEDFKKSDFNQGWSDILDDTLRKFVDETEIISKSVTVNAPAAVIWDILLHPNNEWGKAFGGGAIAETDWQKDSQIIWKDTGGNIGANGNIVAKEENRLLRLQYYEDIDPAPQAALSRYTEEFKLSGGEKITTLEINAGPLVKKDVDFHTGMWDEALKMIKDLAERKITA